MAFCAFNFGFDVGTFGGVQGMQSFADDFGDYNSKTKLWSLSPTLRSVMTSTPFIGKAIVSLPNPFVFSLTPTLQGAIACGMIAERFGRRMAILILCIVSFM